MKGLPRKTIVLWITAIVMVIAGIVMLIFDWYDMFGMMDGWLGLELILIFGGIYLNKRCYREYKESK